MAAPLVTNLQSHGRRRRFLIGVAGLALTLLIAAGFARFGVARGARLVLFVPLLVAALGFLQAQAAT